MRQWEAIFAPSAPSLQNSILPQWPANCASAGLSIWRWALLRITKILLQKMHWYTRMAITQKMCCVPARMLTVKRSKRPSDALLCSSATTKTYLNWRKGHNQTSWCRCLNWRCMYVVGDSRQSGCGRTARGLNNWSCFWTMTTKQAT